MATLSNPKKQADTVSNRLLPHGTQLSCKQFGIESPKKQSVGSMGTLSNLKKDIVNGIDDSDKWYKTFQAEFKKIPGWSEAPSETVEKFTKYCLSMVRLLNKCGRCRKKKYTANEQTEIAEISKDVCLFNLKDAIAEMNKLIYGFQRNFPWEGFKKSKVKGAASNMSGKSLDSMFEEFSIRLISNSAMASQEKDHTGKSVGVQLIPASDYKNGQSGDDAHMCIISAAQQSPDAKNGSTSFGGITKPSSKPSVQLAPDPNDPVPYHQSSQGGGPCGTGPCGVGSPGYGAHGGWFQWGMGNYGSLYRCMLILAEKIVNDFEKFCNSINADKFDMKAAAEFQVKTMQFVTTFGAVNKALHGALKSAKAVVDSIQP
jgi:hypothetical protein